MKGDLTWYLLLPKYSIDSFEMLADSFIKAYAGAKKVHARKTDIFRIAQGESELVREFVTRFQKERILLLVVPDEWASKVFTKGLNPRSSIASQKLKESFLEFQATTWEDVHNRSQFLPYERAKGRGRGFRSANRFSIDRRVDRCRTNRSLRDKKPSASRDISYPRLSKYNFNVSVVELVSAMRNIKKARFPKTMRSNPIQKDPNLWCEYHETNGHRTGDCRNLRDEVEPSLKNGHIREFISDWAKNNYDRNRDNVEPIKTGEDALRQMINMIFGGNEIDGVIFFAA
uniref:Retrotransposon gag domain-containing protein n=2 Tax=Nicotiana TaxID=4085 RepID=A0A1S3ZUE3_TOBAC|nr:PREDICTED: uncharacterized protein LOC104243463 [Nicotiana sylvestris]XP_016468040.1 PREDICTED: uncharacterized protein LOC107790604 [Nicotiana tabacum]